MRRSNLCVFAASLLLWSGSSIAAGASCDSTKSSQGGCRIVSAFKVTAAQWKASADLVSKRVQDSRNAMSEHASKQAQVRRAAEVRQQHAAAEGGQIDMPCFQDPVTATARRVIDLTSETTLANSKWVHRVDASGEMSAGGVTGLFGATTKVLEFPYSASAARRSYRHHTRYCSTAEAAIGICTLQANGMQSGDTDFALHAASGTTFGFDQQEAMADFVKTVAPVKPLPIGSKCKTGNCAAEAASLRRAETFTSLARFSLLRMSESKTTQSVGGDAGIQKVTP